jgi:putative NADPH-quinone reductase
MTRIAIIQGHPDPAQGHLCHALADAYAAGAAEGGHEVRRIGVAALDFPLLQTKTGFDREPAPAALQPCQETLVWADHLVIVHPLWLGCMPARLKAFFEQVLRPGFAFSAGSKFPKATSLAGKSARVVVTMGMPALAYRWYFGAPGLKTLKRNILGFVGIAPVRDSLFGMVDQAGDERRREWLAAMSALGRSAR